MILCTMFVLIRALCTLGQRIQRISEPCSSRQCSKISKLDDLSTVYEATFQARAKWKQMLLALQVNECCKHALANASRHVFAFAQKY